MNSKKVSRFLAACLSLLCLTGGSTVCAAGNDSCELSIPFELSDRKGWIPEGTIFTVRLVSVNGAPLPDKDTYEVDVSGRYEFGPIVFDEPGDYEYTISQVSYESDKIVFDTTVYRVQATVLYNDSGQLVGGFALTRGNSGSKLDEVGFNNDYKVTEDSSRPPSEDSSGADITTSGDSSRTPYSDSSYNGTDIGGDSSGSSSDSGGSSSDSSGTSGSSGEGSQSSGPGSSSGQSGSSKADNGSMLPPNTGGGAVLSISGLGLSAALLFISAKKKREEREEDGCENAEKDDDTG
ncbi:MAG: LPXTG cell wall anchor domain-containing protein [Ruminococcus sp.]|nr:LPXTG cell wall anchor domain-containing protein [Ruminococcus sp.]